MTIIMKFGGASLGNAENIRKVSEIVRSDKEKKPVIVVSALAKVTDLLIAAAHSAAAGKNADMAEIKKIHEKVAEELGIEKNIAKPLLDELADLISGISFTKELTPQTLDRVQSFGERISARIIAEYLKKTGVNAVACDAWDVGIITNSEFGNAEPLNLSHIKEKISRIRGVPVITGFIGKDNDGRITTLGRGGSDYTAALIGAAIDASEIQLWKDTDGIMSADPTVVENAKLLGIISFNECAELAYFGARILHPKTILPAVDNEIPIRVLNTFKPNASGTTIVKNAKDKVAVRGIAFKKGITLINIVSTRMLGPYGFLAELFEIFRKHKTSVDVIATSEVSVSVTVESREIKKLVEDLKKIANVDVKAERAIICVVGNGLREGRIQGDIFKVVEENRIEIEMISEGASKINLTFVVNWEDAEKTVKLLHRRFVEK